MAHLQQIEFCKKIKSLFPNFFEFKLVLDIGSLDVNGNNRYLFDNCTYLGVDIDDGKNVDFISIAGKLQLPDASIDTIISTECFEHDPFYRETLLNAYRMLKPGGLLIFTCATDGREEHGTSRSHPEDAPFLQTINEWKDYYCNLNEKHIREVFAIEDHFKKAVFEVNNESHDLYFYGFKRGDFSQRKNSYYSCCELEKSLHAVNMKLLAVDAKIVEKNIELAEKNVKLVEQNTKLVEVSSVVSEIKQIIHSQIQQNANKRSLRSIVRFLNKGWSHKTAYKICNESHFFNKDWYLHQYSDVSATGFGPVRHYIEVGAMEGRDPGPDFSTITYTIANPEIIKKGINPLVHFEKKSRAPYQKWIKLHDTLSRKDRKLITNKINAFKTKPLISVLMTVYNTPEKWLVGAIESIQKQLYPHWELCIADNASTEVHAQDILQSYAAKDPRIKVIYREEHGCISTVLNDALQLATGEFVAILGHCDELAEYALYKVADEINKHPNTALIYSDEDNLDFQGKRFDPYFKSDWNPDLMYGQNFIGHSGIYRRSMMTEINGFREEFAGAQDYDLALRLIEKISSDQIRHIPHILYHGRITPHTTASDIDSTPSEVSRKAIQSHLDRQGVIGAQVVKHPFSANFHRVIYPVPNVAPLVSIIIPTKDKVHLLKCCVNSVLSKTDYTNFEIIIVDNQSVEQETHDYYQQLATNQNINIIFYDSPFDYSKINNFAVQKAQGELITLLNNDTEVINPEWLSEMVSHAIRPDVGIVGAKLYYPDDTIQHAGVIGSLGTEKNGVADHLYRKLPKTSAGYFGKAMLTQNFLAVTAACMTMRRHVFLEVGGLLESVLAVAFNDVDLCLKVYQKGYRIVWTPFAELYHYESASRGRDQTVEQKAREQREVQYMLANWRELLHNDPFYNPNLRLSGSEHCALAFPPRHV